MSFTSSIAVKERFIIIKYKLEKTGNFRIVTVSKLFMKQKQVCQRFQYIIIIIIIIIIINNNKYKTCIAHTQYKYFHMCITENKIKINK